MVIVADGLGKYKKQAIWLLFSAIGLAIRCGNDTTRVAIVADGMMYEFNKRFPDDPVLS